MRIAIITSMISGLLLQTAFQPLNSAFPSASADASSPTSPITDYNGDGYTDLAVGAAFEDLNGESAGAVNVIYGSPTGGLSATYLPNQLWSQSVPGVKDLAKAVDRFGRTLASADFNHDGYTDLAIAAPRDDIDGTVNAGGVNVLYGSSHGLVVDGNQFWHRGSPGIKGINTPSPDHDNFGMVMAVGDFNGDRYYDLAITSPEGPGEVNILYGSAAGLTAEGNQKWSQAS